MPIAGWHENRAKRDEVKLGKTTAAKEEMLVRLDAQIEAKRTTLRGLDSEERERKAATERWCEDRRKECEVECDEQRREIAELKAKTASAYYDELALAKDAGERERKQIRQQTVAALRKTIAQLERGDDENSDQ